MTAEQGSPTTSAGNSLLDELPDVFAGGAAWEYVAAIEREARQQARDECDKDVLAAVDRGYRLAEREETP